MNEKTCRQIKFWYGIFLSAFTAVVGVLFLWQVLDLYFTYAPQAAQGLPVYTVERVRAHLARIAIPFWIWIACSLAGIGLAAFLPSSPAKRKADRSHIYRRMKKRLLRTAPEGAQADIAAGYAQVQSADRVALILKWVAAALCLAGAIYAVIYLAMPVHFPKEDVKGEMVKMCAHLLPVIGAGFVLWCGIAVFEALTERKNFDTVKRLTRGISGERPPVGLWERTLSKAGEIGADARVLLGVRIAVACLAVAFIVAGICNGGARETFIKAINICTECIGLG